MSEKVINEIVNCLKSPAYGMLPIILGLIVGLLLCNLHVTYKYQKRIKKQPQNKDYLEKELEKEKKQVIIYWLAIVFILIAPIAINFFFSSNIQFPTAPHLGNTEWLGFWGSYTGGVIGAIVTGIAFFFTYRQNQNQHEQTRKQMVDQQRLQVLPFLAINEVSYGSWLGNKQRLDLSIDTTQEKSVYIGFHIKNISSFPALFFELEGGNGCKTEHILPGQIGVCEVRFPIEDKTFNFNLLFKDSLGNRYCQTVTIKCKADTLKKCQPQSFTQPSFPELISNPSYKTDPSTRQPSEVNP